MAGAGAPAFAAGAMDQPVKTRQGLVSGTDSEAEGVRVFKGIPFAAAPVGEWRFREAQPPKAWTGVRDGSKWGDTCIQPPARPGRSASTRRSTCRIRRR
jgi:para-nitrobenzyl esterase